MVASQWPWRLDFLAAAIKRSISAVVRYSRVRTEEFTVVGADRPPVQFSTIFCPRFERTGELSSGLSESAQDPEPPARGSPRDLGIGIDAGEIDGPVWSVFGRGTGGPLDRVAQLADRKYCRPHARPFRLGFTRKVPVFPVCPLAAL